MDLSAGRSSFLIKVILRDQYNNNVLDVGTDTFTAQFTGNNMDPLDLSVQTVSKDNTGESKLYITIGDTDKTG